MLPIVTAVLALLFGLRAYAPGAANPTDLVLLDWIPVARAPVVVGVHVDEMTLVFAALAGVLLVPLLVAQLVDRGRHGLSRRAPLIEVGAIVAFLGIILAGDTLILYVFWEVAGFSLFMLDRQRRATSSFGPLLSSHLSGYGLLLAVLIVAHADSGSFHLVGIEPTAWHWTVVLMIVLAAIGRIVLAWTLSWEGDGYAPVFVTVLAALSSGYLLIRTYSLAGVVLQPPFDALLSLIGAGVALYGAIVLTGRQRTRWTSAVERSLVVDIGLVVAALGIGSALGLASALVGVTAMAMSRLPAAVSSTGETQADSGVTGQAIAIGTATALPPVVGFAARALLCAAAIDGMLIPLLLLVVAVTAVEVRAVVASAVQARLLAEALKEVEEPEAPRSETDVLRELGARLAQSDLNTLDDSDDLDDIEDLAAGELPSSPRHRPSRALAAPDRALLILCAPLLLFGVVPAALAALLRPALHAVLGESSALAGVSRSIAEGAGLPAVIAVVVGILLGLLVAAGGQPASRRAAERRSRSLLTSRRRADADDAASDLPVAPVPAALEGISRGLGQLAGAIERHPIAVTVATAVVVIALAMLS